MSFRRFDSLDALRGMAIVWMTAYHFCFDLNHFGYLHQNFYTDPVWTWQRTAIVSLFLFTAGLGQAVAVHQHQRWPRFWRRWVQVAGSALLVSAGSYVMYPQSFIYFGVLHGLAVMLLIVRLSAGWGRWLWLLGGAAIALKFLAVSAHAAWPAIDFLNQNIWNWLGLISRKPITEDYVPLVPWLGVMWWGMASGRWVLRQRPHWLQLQAMPAVPLVKALAGLGRWSLSYYLLHQPVLIGLLMAISALK
ncbi:hypothetical protein BH10PSE16_BH10PSE16_16360 [soil metagenome]